MKNWLKYVLIFGIIFAIIGFFLGPFIYAYTLSCPTDPVTGEVAPCMGNPYFWRTPGVIIGLLIGAVIGIIIERIISKLSRRT